MAKNQDNHKKYPVGSQCSCFDCPLSFIPHVFNLFVFDVRPGSKIYKVWKTQFPRQTDDARSLHVQGQAEKTDDRLFAACVRFQKAQNGTTRQEVLDAMWCLKEPTSKDVNAVFEFLLLHKPKSKGPGAETILDIGKWAASIDVKGKFAKHVDAIRGVLDDALVQVLRSFQLINMHLLVYATSPLRLISTLVVCQNFHVRMLLLSLPSASCT